MKTVCDKNKCCGCYGCVNVCNRNAIRISDSGRSFNAIIDADKCVNCGKCVNICQMNNEVDKKKPVIVCGDLNVAHQEIDLKNPKSNRKNAGFTDEEREKMTVLLNAGFTDTWRFFNPDVTDVYSWWSYRFKAREKNAGWRIDYFLVSNRLQDRLTNAKIHTEIYGSDHCPVELEIKD